MGCTSAKTSSNNARPIIRIKEVLYWETDVWKLSGMPIDMIKRRFVKVHLEGQICSIRTAVVQTGDKSEEKKTLILCHDYMEGAPISWYPFIKDLSQHFRLVMPDLGTYGANTRINDCENVNRTGDVAERFVLEWWDKWIEAMKDSLPEKFYLCGIANGGFQAGLYASHAPERIEKLLIMSPARFCPPPTDDFDPYVLEMSLSQNGDRYEKKHIYEYIKERSDA